MCLLRVCDDVSFYAQHRLCICTACALAAFISFHSECNVAAAAAVADASAAATAAAMGNNFQLQRAY